MAGGLAALLDDVALIARAAAASIDDVALQAVRTSGKAVGVVVDDTAVTPRFIQGVTPARELPMIWRIVKGSLVNKIIIILPIALLLNTIAPWALTPILMVGGFLLSYEGAEKIWEMITGKHKEKVKESGAKDEDSLVKGATRTDLILSAEIMVISLNEVSSDPVWMEAIILIIVAFFITFLVYGFVAILVKMDDLGLALVKKSGGEGFLNKLGTLLVKGMPKVLDVISFIGMFAMLWVGGHILVTGLNNLGVHAPYEFIHSMVHHVEHMGGAVTWITETFFSLLFGFFVGSIIVGIVDLIHKFKKPHEKAPKKQNDDPKKDRTYAAEAAATVAAHDEAKQTKKKVGAAAATGATATATQTKTDTEHSDS